MGRGRYKGRVGKMAKGKEINISFMRRVKRGMRGVGQVRLD